MYVNIKYNRSKFGTMKLNFVNIIIAVNTTNTIVASVIDIQLILNSLLYDIFTFIILLVIIAINEIAKTFIIVTDTVVNNITIDIKTSVFCRISFCFCSVNNFNVSAFVKFSGRPTCFAIDEYLYFTIFVFGCFTSK